jgi:hypothetical protein
MTSSSPDPLKPEAKTGHAHTVSRHKSRQRKRLAAKIVLVLALVTGGIAVGHFAYNAYVRADCYTGEEIDLWGNMKKAAPKSDGCSADVSYQDELLQWDAAVTLISMAIVMGSIRISRKLKPHRR